MRASFDICTTMPSPSVSWTVLFLTTTPVQGVQAGLLHPMDGRHSHVLDMLIPLRAMSATVLPSMTTSLKALGVVVPRTEKRMPALPSTSFELFPFTSWMLRLLIL